MELVISLIVIFGSIAAVAALFFWYISTPKGRGWFGEVLTTWALGKDKIHSSDCPIIGNEGHGVSTDVLSVCDATMIIPMSGKTESLNAAIAAAVILWEYGRESL